MNNFKVVEKSQVEKDLAFYLTVEPNYHIPSEGKGSSRAINFEMGQYTTEERGIDSMISCSTEQARTFAEAILKTCEEIEGVN